MLEKPVLFDVTELFGWGQQRNLITVVGKAGFIWCHGTPISHPLGFHSLPLEKPVLFDVTERDHGQYNQDCAGWKSRFYLMSRNIHLLEVAIFVVVGKAGFIWCHGTTPLLQTGQRFLCWKSRFYLMSRNSFYGKQLYIEIWLEKPVLFDVKERKLDKIWKFWKFSLEKPVLFDVTERIL